MRVESIAKIVRMVSDDVAALILVVGGLYIAIKHDFNQGYSFVSLGVGYLFGSHIPKTKEKLENGGGKNG